MNDISGLASDFMNMKSETKAVKTADAKEETARVRLYRSRAVSGQLGNLHRTAARNSFSDTEKKLLITA